MAFRGERGPAGAQYAKGLSAYTIGSGRAYLPQRVRIPEHAIVHVQSAVGRYLCPFISSLTRGWPFIGCDPLCGPRSTRFKTGSNILSSFIEPLTFSCQFARSKTRTRSLTRSLHRSIESLVILPGRPISVLSRMRFFGFSLRSLHRPVNQTRNASLEI